MSRSLRANLMLLTTALIWGVAFVAQDVAMDFMPPFAFNAARMLLAGLVLVPCIALLKRRAKAAGSSAPRPEGSPGVPSALSPFLPGLLCGAALFLGSSFQQFGIRESSPGKAGFITALYIVLVPLAGLFGGKRVRLRVWLAVGVAAAGLFLLCVTSAFSIGPGDLFLILCAFCFTAHILLIDHFAPKTDCLKMSCVQFFVASFLCLVASVLWEKPTWEGARQALVPILYAGALSGAVGYTLQILGQRDTSPTVASLLMCLESVFAVLAGWALLGDMLSPRELAGCALMLAGIVLAQLPQKEKQPVRPAASRNPC